MRTLLATFFITSTLFMFFGCTAKLASRSVEKNKVAEGLVYQLPATRIDIALTYELVECADKPEVRLVGATYTSHLVPDNRPEATFAIDTTALQSGTKTIPEASITLQNNILTGVNYKAEDKTGDIIGKVAEIAALANGIPLPKVLAETKALDFGQLEGAKGEEGVCSIMAQNAIANKKKLETMIEATNSEINTALDQIQKGYLASNPNAREHEKFIATLRNTYHEAVQRLANDKLNDTERVKLAETVASLQKHLATEESAFTSSESAWIKGRETALAAFEKKLAQLISQTYRS